MKRKTNVRPKPALEFQTMKTEKRVDDKWKGALNITHSSVGFLFEYCSNGFWQGLTLGLGEFLCKMEITAEDCQKAIERYQLKAKN